MATIQQLYEHLETLVNQWVYSKSQSDELLTGKVDKESGKSLTSNDFSNAYKTKLDNIEAEANKTIVDSSWINNSTNPVQSKVVQAKVSDLTTAIGTKASSADLSSVATSGSYLDLLNIPSSFNPTTHTHSATEVSDASAYSNIGTSADATQHDINSAINSKLGSILGLDIILVVDSLPTASNTTMNKFYLVAEQTTETHDAYEIYITVRTGTSGNYSYAWEKVDTARIDLSDYVTTDDYRLTNARTPTSHTHGNLSNDGTIGSTSGKLVMTTTGGALTTSDLVSEMDTVVQSLIAHGNSE